MVASRVPLLSPEEYLAWEEKAEVRHEYIDGEIFAMSGSSDDHATIVLNCSIVLTPLVRGAGCRIYPQDVKAKIHDQSRYYYPDLLVTCDPRVGVASQSENREDKYVKRHYKMIVEVLSASTEAFDSLSETQSERGKKFEDYRRSESLEEYLLVAQDRVSVDVFRRNAAGKWEFEGYGPGDVVEVVSLGATLAIGDLYEDVEIVPEADGD
jgi:Uma2 family endonuclease